MIATKRITLYEKAVLVTEEYLGPAGERFLRRQINTHLNIEPEQLSKKNLPKLINWSSIAFALLTNNPKVIEAFTNDLRSLILNGK
ncbi:hypothetical protein H0V99_03500 [Candidatus Saccharibacteria bacterium]|nr:hypothetical protein [Candidatus Saccharibacteria bacterium]